MLLILSDSVARLEFSTNHNHCNAIENILSSAFEGKNIVLADRNVISALLGQKQYLSYKSVSFLKHLKSSYSEKLGIKELVETRIIIDPSQSQVDHQDKVFTVPLQIFSDRSVSDAVALLCEHLIDCKLYEHAAKHYAHSRNIRGVTLSTDRRHGGGSTTQHIVQEISSQRRSFCLCVVDSDKYSPQSALGSTAQKCLAAVDLQWVMKVTVTPDREGENVIPLGLLLVSQSGCVLDRVVELEEISRDSGSDMMGYLDYKGGTTLGWVLEKTNVGTPQREFWIDKISANTRLQRSLSMECVRDQRCDNPGHCSCAIFPGLSARLLESVVRWLDMTTTQKSYEAIGKHRHDSWLAVGKEVFEWCCGYERIRS